MVNQSAWLGYAFGGNMHTLQEACKDMYVILIFSRHPDKNNDPAAENRFVEINQAYEVRS